jgi:hypothetical protein
MQFPTIISSTLGLLRTSEALVKVCQSTINGILCTFYFALVEGENISLSSCDVFVDR